MKIIFILIFFILHCGSVYFIKNDAPVLTDEELNLLKSRKIGLIGFSPFRISKFSEIHTAVPETVNDPAYRKMLLWLNKNGKKAEYNENMFLMFTGGKYAKVLRAYPDRKNRTLKFTGFGTEIGSLKWEEGESSRNTERTAEMAADWHSRMNHYAFADLKLILDFSEYEMNPKIRKYDADYWVTAYHGFAEILKKGP
ncbi:MAG TPA: hypothetical protein PKV80_08920 [Leptospiraceae bacterium]|nr:hypothetical protein [Leptospiraceae bacterium]